MKKTAIAFLILIVITTLVSCTNKKIPGKTSSVQETSSGDADQRVATPEMAEEIVAEYLKNNNKYIPTIIEAQEEDENTFLVHCYDIVKENEDLEHTATSGWYSVNKTDGSIKDALLENK